MPSPYLHPCAICAPMCQAFKMQPKLHNSADRGISKFVSLRLRLVVCFYPRPPAWPWSWGYTYLYLPVCFALSCTKPTYSNSPLISHFPLNFTLALMCNASVLRVIVIPSFSASPRLTKQMDTHSIQHPPARYNNTHLTVLLVFSGSTATSSKVPSAPITFDRQEHHKEIMAALSAKIVAIKKRKLALSP